VFGPELDEGVGRFGLVRRQAGQIRVAPVAQIDNASGLDCCLRGVGRLHHVDTIAVKEERVIPEQVADAATATGTATGGGTATPRSASARAASGSARVSGAAW
jgi:hypothetical protein